MADQTINPATLSLPADARTVLPARTPARLLLALPAAVALHGALLVPWLFGRSEPYGHGGRDLDAITVGLVDARALETAVPSLTIAGAANIEVVAPAEGNAAVTVAASAQGVTANAPSLDTEPAREIRPPAQDAAATPVQAHAVQARAAPVTQQEQPAAEPANAPNGAPIDARPSTDGGSAAHAKQPEAGPVPAAAAAPAGALGSYRASVAAALRRTHPSATGKTGKVRLTFVIAATGRLDTLAVEQSSGSPTLDELAVGAVRRARFEVPPAAMTADQRTFTMRYVFQ